MATTEMEPGSEHGTADPDSKYPLKVLYCGGTVQRAFIYCSFSQSLLGGFDPASPFFLQFVPYQQR